MAKFTDICIDLGFKNEIFGALRKLSKQELLVPDYRLIKIKDCIDKINIKHPDMNACFFGEIEQLISTPSMQVNL